MVDRTQARQWTVGSRVDLGRTGRAGDPPAPSRSSTPLFEFASVRQIDGQKTWHAHLVPFEQGYPLIPIPFPAIHRVYHRLMPVSDREPSACSGPIRDGHEGPLSRTQVALETELRNERTERAGARPSLIVRRRNADGSQRIMEGLHVPGAVVRSLSQVNGLWMHIREDP
jgi:hypothetical protein